MEQPSMPKWCQSFHSRRLVSPVLILTILFASLAGVVQPVFAISVPTDTPYVETFDNIGTAATASLPADFRVDRIGTVRSWTMLDFMSDQAYDVALATDSAWSGSDQPNV